MAVLGRSSAGLEGTESDKRATSERIQRREQTIQRANRAKGTERTVESSSKHKKHKANATTKNKSEDSHAKTTVQNERKVSEQTQTLLVALSICMLLNFQIIMILRDVLTTVA